MILLKDQKFITFQLIIFFLIPFSFFAKEYNVLDFGAKGDGKINITNAINTANSTAANNGGGTVYFPAGDYIPYTIHFKSNITIYLDNGAVLIGDKEVNGKGYELPEYRIF